METDFAPIHVGIIQKYSKHPKKKPPYSLYWKLLLLSSKSYIRPIPLFASTSAERLFQNFTWLMINVFLQIHNKQARLSQCSCFDQCGKFLGRQEEADFSR